MTAQHDDNADHSCRLYLRNEYPCHDCGQPPLRGCVAGWYPGWRQVSTHLGHYSFARRCPHNITQHRQQQTQPQPRPQRRRKHTP